MGRLSEGKSVTLNAQGAGSVQLGPTTSARSWRVSRFTTYGNSTLAPTLTVRRGSTGGPVVDVSRFANADVSETSLDVFAGESIVAAYAGGTAGAVMSFYVEGEAL